VKQTLISIVTFYPKATLAKCIASIQKQLGDYRILIIDNSPLEVDLPEFGANVEVIRNGVNLGFAAAHNIAAHRVVNDVNHYDGLLVCNPDIFFPDVHIVNKFLEISNGERVVVPRLLRASSTLEPIMPELIDSTGIIFTKTFRHLDRGRNEIAASNYLKGEYVSGGSGALIYLPKKIIAAVSFRAPYDEDMYLVYPQLRNKIELRVQLFDEAFFAYREDADLSCRLQHLGFKIWYEPSIVAYHERVVSPEKRKEIGREINSMSVRNRFLLQINNFSFCRWGWQVFFLGILWRNFTVIVGVLLIERYSVKGLKEVFILARRAFRRRQKILVKFILVHLLFHGLKGLQ
jgi:GT2 family glycosyltransferase